MADPSIKDLAYRGLAATLGGPVDIATAIMRPFGYSTPEQQIVGGSEWIGKKMQDIGLVSSARNPLQEFAASMIVPSPDDLYRAAALAPAMVGSLRSASKIDDVLRGIPQNKYKADISRLNEEDFIDYANAIMKSKNGTASAKNEASAAALSGVGNKFVVYDGSNIAGAAAFDVDPQKKTIFIDHIGSLVKGTGRQMVEEIEKIAQPGFKIVLTPSQEGLGFWKKMGFSETGQGSLMQKLIE